MFSFALSRKWPLALLWTICTRKTGKDRKMTITGRDEGRNIFKVCNMLPNMAGRPLIGGHVRPALSVNSRAKQLWDQALPASQHNGCNTPSISTLSSQSSLAPFVHRRKPHRKEELEPQCADIPSPKHSPSSLVSSRSLLIACLNGGRRSTCALLEVSSSTYRRPLTDYSCPPLLTSLLSLSHPVNTRCRRPQTSPRRMGLCEDFGRRTQWKYSHHHLLHV